MNTQRLETYQSSIEKDYQFIERIVLERNGKAVSPSWVAGKCLEFGCGSVGERNHLLFLLQLFTRV